MLRRACAAICVVAFVVAIPTEALAKRRPPPVVVSGNNNGVVQTIVTDPGRDGVPVAGKGSSTSTHSRCYWQVIYYVAQLPLPDMPYKGTWYGEFCGGPDYVAVVWVPDKAVNRPPVRHTPATLAQQAVNQMPLPAPAVRHNPSGDAMVNLATWWWVDPSQWRSMTQRTAVGPVWATVTARPVKSVWNPGDGSAPVTCSGGGTPYDANRPSDGQHTDCSFTYRESSASQPQTGPGVNDRFFTVSVTVYWQVSFVGAGGARGVLPMMTRTSRFPLRVDERQTVVTGGSG